MDTLKGNLLKMETDLQDTVQYTFVLGKERVLMNPLIGKQLRFTFEGEINCIECGKRTKSSYAQGFCYSCMISSPMAEPCVLRPELCRAHEGEARDMEFAKSHCLTDHFVYLALSSAVKVGITRHTQIPTRWIDQGAWKAIKLAQTEDRYTAGVIEVALKDHFTDKTNWRHMLTNKLALDVDLVEEKEGVWELLPEELQAFMLEDDDVITEINYPVGEYPNKVTSVGFDKLPVIEGRLTGIKGQYLMLDNKFVLNVRKHNGYMVSLEVLD